MPVPKQVALSCGCMSVLQGGVYHCDHTCSLQARRADRLQELHQSQVASNRRLGASLYREPFSILRGGNRGK